MNHDRVYTLALGVLGAFAATSAFVCQELSGSVPGAVEINVPPRWLGYLALVNFVYTVAILVTLILRRLKPALGRSITRGLNWALLPALPGGTVVGLYGLYAVDKD